MIWQLSDFQPSMYALTLSQLALVWSSTSIARKIYPFRCWRTGNDVHLQVGVADPGRMPCRQHPSNLHSSVISSTEYCILERYRNA